MAINRFSRQRLRNQFVPITTQEYAQVPMAMTQLHAMQDMSLASMNLKYNALPSDSDFALQTAQSFENKVGQAVSDLQASGITPDTQSTIRDLAIDYSDIIRGPMAAVNDRFNTVAAQKKQYDEARKESKGADNWFVDMHETQLQKQIDETPIAYEGFGQYNRIKGYEYSAPIEFEQETLDLAEEVLKDGSSYLRPINANEAAILGPDAGFVVVEGKYYGVDTDKIKALFGNYINNPRTRQFLTKLKTAYPDMPIGIFPGEDSFVTDKGAFNKKTFAGRVFEAAMNAKGAVDITENYKFLSPSTERGAGKVHDKSATVMYDGVRVDGKQNVVDVYDINRAYYEQQVGELDSNISQNEDALKQANVTIDENLATTVYTQAKGKLGTNFTKDSVQKELFEIAKARNIPEDQQSRWVETVLLRQQKAGIEADSQEMENQFKQFINDTLTPEQSELYVSLRAATMGFTNKQLTQNRNDPKYGLAPINELRGLRGLPEVTDEQLLELSGRISNLILNPDFWIEEDKWNLSVGEVQEAVEGLMVDYFQITNDEFKALKEKGGNMFTFAPKEIARALESNFNALESKVGAERLMKLNAGPTQGYKLVYSPGALPKNAATRDYHRANDIKLNSNSYSNEVLTNGQMLNNYLPEYAKANGIGEEWTIKDASMIGIGVPAVGYDHSYSIAELTVEFLDIDSGVKTEKIMQVALSDNYGIHKDHYGDKVTSIMNAIYSPTYKPSSSEKVGASKAYAKHVLNAQESVVLSQVQRINNTPLNENTIGEKIMADYTSQSGNDFKVAFEVVENRNKTRSAKIRPVTVNGVPFKTTKDLDLSTDEIMAFIGQVEYAFSNRRDDLLIELGFDITN